MNGCLKSKREHELGAEIDHAYTRSKRRQAGFLSVGDVGLCAQVILCACVLGSTLMAASVRGDLTTHSALADIIGVIH